MYTGHRLSAGVGRPPPDIQMPSACLEIQVMRILLTIQTGQKKEEPRDHHPRCQSSGKRSNI